MKSVIDVQKEISEVQSNIREFGRSKLKSDLLTRRNLIKRIPFLTQIFTYLKTGSQEEFIERELARLKNRLFEIQKLYVPLDSERHMKSQIAKHKKEFEKEWRFPS